jgi:hypothetical protein
MFSVSDIHWLVHLHVSDTFCERVYVYSNILGNLTKHNNWNYLSTMALQPLVGPWPLFQFLHIFTESVGRFGRGISPSQDRYLHTEQHKHRINEHRHPCFKWDSKPRTQCLRGRRQFVHWTARPL